ncbi:MAG: T9SS type A sorting domain-containing protein [Bacteroidales bacterium]|jgi:hypothetical protein|nr:T9SS type A sorting domain-containing protein [Bacteroidales bacterium]
MLSYNLLGDPSLQVRYNDCTTDMKLYTGTTDADETIHYKPATNITVAGNSPSYVTNQYTVKSGGCLTLKANESIILKPGFVAEAGSSFSAITTSETCTKSNSSNMTPTRTDERNTTDAKTMDENTGKTTDIFVDMYPNPFSESFTLSFKCDAPSNVFVRLHDINGNLIKIVADSILCDAGMHQFTVNGADLAEGIYLLELNINRKNILFKIIKNKQT